MPNPAPENTLDISTMPSFSEKEAHDPSVTINALDAAFSAAGGNPAKPEEPLAELGEPKVKDKPAPPAKPAAPIKADDEELPVTKELPNAGDTLDDLERKTREPKEEKSVPKADETPAPKKDEKPPVAEKDEFDAVELPSNVKPKTVESFDKVKNVARERIAAVNKEKEALAKQVEELTAKAAGPALTKEVEAELKTLREFRAKLDVEASPEWGSYDKTVADNTEAIYARLLATPGIDKVAVDKIKELGGPAEVDWDSPNIKLPSQVRRFLDAKLVENETVSEKKAKAISDAKNNAEQYISTRRKEQTDGAQLQNKAVETEIELLRPKFEWLKELKAKEGASTEEVAAVTEHNKMVENVNQTLKDAVTDNSPQMRSILAMGYGMLLKTRADFSDFRAKATAKETAASEEKAALTKELEEVKGKLEKIKRSSTTRLRDTPAEDGNQNKSKQVDLSTPGTDALDKHLAAIQAARE